MRKYIFSKEQEKQIDTKYFSKETLSIPALAKINNCSNATIYNTILRNGHTPRTISEAKKDKSKIFSKEQEVQIGKRYVEDKLSTFELAKELNCTPETICNVLRRNGIKLRTKSEAMYGKHLSELTKQKLREKAILQHQTQHGFYKDTKPELKMEEILIFLNIPYEKQFRVGNHIVDFHLLNTNTLIEVDGDYWHGNLKKYTKLTERQLKQKERDIKNDHAAKEKGYIVLRFWQSDILKNKEKVIKKLKRVL